LEYAKINDSVCRNPDVLDRPICGLVDTAAVRTVATSVDGLSDVIEKKTEKADCRFKKLHMKTGQSEGRFLQNQRYYKSKRDGLGWDISYVCS
jgi:hypothetical protein